MRCDRSTAFFLATAALVSSRALGACIGEDPSLTSSSADGGANSSDSSATTDGDTPAAADFTFDPPSIDLAPGEATTLKIRGATSIATIALSVSADPLPDGGTPPSGTVSAITLGTSSVSLASSGEATVQVQASPEATQHHFRITGASGAVSRVVAGRVTGKPGEPDIFFGDKGGYFDLAPDGDCTANSVLVEADGRFVVAGTSKSYSALWVARFTPDGKLDPSFGPTKAGFVSLGAARGPQMERMSDGSIAISALAPNDPKLYRITSDGRPDPAWGGESGVDPQLGGPNFESGPIGKQGDNVLVGGGTTNTAAAIKRYLPNGTLDTSFGSGGSASFTLVDGPATPGASPRVHAIAVESTGTFWVAGQYSSASGPPYERTYVRRFKADGSPDNVSVTATYQGAVTALALQDGKAIAGAFDYPNGNYSAYLFRVTNALDGTFGTAGKSLVVGPPGGFPTSIATDADGRIYVANGAYTTSSFDAYRQTANGTRDTSFGANGILRIETGRAYGLALAGRQLIVVGVNDGNDQRRARIARFWR